MLRYDNVTVERVKSALRSRARYPNRDRVLRPAGGYSPRRSGAARPPVDNLPDHSTRLWTARRWRVRRSAHRLPCATRILKNARLLEKRRCPGCRFFEWRGCQGPLGWLARPAAEGEDTGHPSGRSEPLTHSERLTLPALPGDVGQRPLNIPPADAQRRALFSLETTSGHSQLKTPAVK